MKWLLMVIAIIGTGCTSHITPEGRVKQELWTLFEQNNAWSRDDKIQLFEDCIASSAYGVSEKRHCNYWLAQYLLECVSGYACESDRRQALSIAKNLLKTGNYGAVYYFIDDDKNNEPYYTEDYVDLLARSYHAAGDFESAYKTLYQVHDENNMLKDYAKVIIENRHRYEPCEPDCGKNYAELLVLFRKAMSSGDKKTAKKILDETKDDADAGNTSARNILAAMYKESGKIKEAEKYQLGCMDDEYDSFQGYRMSALMWCKVFIASYYGELGNHQERFRRDKENFYLFGFPSRLAGYYYEGEVVDKDKGKAAYFYELSSNEDFPDWDYVGMAAYMYAIADGVERDCSKARYFIERLHYFSKESKINFYKEEYEKTIKKIRSEDNSCGL